MLSQSRWVQVFQRPGSPPITMPDGRESISGCKAGLLNRLRDQDHRAVRLEWLRVRYPRDLMDQMQSANSPSPSWRYPGLHASYIAIISGLIASLVVIDRVLVW